jgi:twitching motility protein PilI
VTQILHEHTLPVAASNGPMRLGFVTAGTHWLVDAGSGLQVIDAAITPVPLTQPWFLGLVRHRQQLLGAIDLSGLRGAEVGPLRPTERLLVLPERWRSALRVDRVQGLMNATAQAAAQADGVLWQVLDIEALCTSPDFLHAGLRQTG